MSFYKPKPNTRDPAGQMTIIHRFGIRFRHVRNYKYQLLSQYTFTLPPAFGGQNSIEDMFLAYEKTGRKLIIKKGHAWDGPSGPSLDTPDFMRASLVHDCLYQLMHFAHGRHPLNGKFSYKMKPHADKLLAEIAKQDGMTSFRANYVHMAVKLFGGMQFSKQEKRS